MLKRGVLAPLTISIMTRRPTRGWRGLTSLLVEPSEELRAAHEDSTADAGHAGELAALQHGDRDPRRAEPSKTWHDYINDPTVADSICDRVVHNAHRVELKGPSRLKGKAELGD